MDGLQEEWGEACARAPVNPGLNERLTQALPEQISPGDCHFQWETGDRNNPRTLSAPWGVHWVLLNLQLQFHHAQLYAQPLLASSLVLWETP